MCFFFLSSRRRHTRCALVTGVQTCALPIYSTVDPAVDYEVELTVIIGKGGRGIKKADALKHVWGYTIVNDVTARDLQGRHSQWLIGKSQDTFCRSEEHTSELQSLMRISYAVFCLKKKRQHILTSYTK